MPQTVPFRRPLPPSPIEAFDIPHPDLPPALDGLTVLHLSDTHARRLRRGRHRWQDLHAALRATPADLVVLTGDFMDEPGQEGFGITELRDLAASWTARRGAFGVFGNHDTPAFRRLASGFPGIRWLGGDTADVPGLPLRLAGLDWPEDAVSLALRARLVASSSGDPAPFTAVLAHVPTVLVPLAGLGVPLILAGHTHAGQVRLSPRFAPHTSSDVPPWLAGGALRLGRTLCCVSRGLGDGIVEGSRLNCPPQAPLYTLRRGPLPGADATGPTQAIAW